MPDPARHTTTVSFCARCQQDHAAVTFEPLTHPLVHEHGHILASHWAPCPTNGQPILMRFAADDA